MKKQGFWAKLLGKTEAPVVIQHRPLPAAPPPVAIKTPTQQAELRRAAEAYRAQRGGRSRGPVTTPTHTQDTTSSLYPYVAMTASDSSCIDTRPTPAPSPAPAPAPAPEHSSGYSFGGGGDFGGGGGGDFGGGGSF